MQTRNHHTLLLPLKSCFLISWYLTAKQLIYFLCTSSVSDLWYLYGKVLDIRINIVFKSIITMWQFIGNKLWKNLLMQNVHITWQLVLMIIQIYINRRYLSRNCTVDLNPQANQIIALYTPPIHKYRSHQIAKHVLGTTYKIKYNICCHVKI